MQSISIVLQDGSFLKVADYDGTTYHMTDEMMAIIVTAGLGALRDDPVYGPFCRLVGD